MEDAVAYLFKLTIYNIPYIGVNPRLLPLLGFVGLFASRLTNGIKHGAVVYNGRTDLLHKIDFWHEGAYWLLAFATGLPIGFVFGVWMIGGPAFQIPINLGTNGTMFGESDSWEVFGMDVPKPFAGPVGRPVQFMLGVAFVVLSFAAPYISTVQVHA